MMFVSELCVIIFHLHLTIKSNEETFVAKFPLRWKCLRPELRWNIDEVTYKNIGFHKEGNSKLSCSDNYPEDGRDQELSSDELNDYGLQPEVPCDDVERELEFPPMTF